MGRLYKPEYEKSLASKIDSLSQLITAEQKRRSGADQTVAALKKQRLRLQDELKSYATGTAEPGAGRHASSTG